MKKKTSIRCSSLHISWLRMILVFGVLLFVSQSILHAEIEKDSFDFDGRLRSYMVYLPSDYTGSTNFPLVIYLHSYGTTAQQEMDYTQLNQVADASDFVVVYPSGIPNWNSDVVNIPRFPNPDVDDVGFINALIDTMNNNYSIDLERVYACGFSNGGAMTFRLAFQLGDRIAAIASVGGPVSPSVAEAYKLVSRIPVLYIHGTRDTIVPFNGNSDFPSVEQTLSIWTNFNNCVQTETTILPDLDQTDGCTVEKVSYTNCADNCNVLLYKVIDGGHTWPGARPGYASGNTNQDINAGAEIWNFFTNYKLITPPVFDFNSDEIVDSLDVCIMIDNWGTNDPLCDIAPRPFGDGIVDVQDLIMLAEHLFEEIYPPELIAYWKLDEEEGDIAYNSIGDNHGILTGNPLWKPDSGQIAGTIEFDGISNYITTDFVLDPSLGAFSVFAWIKSTVPKKMIISQSNGNGAGSTWLGIDDLGGNLMTGLVPPAVGRFVPQPLVSEFIITDGQWHHIGFAWDGSFRALYVNGVEVAKDTAPQNPLKSANGGLYISADKTLDAGTFFSGLIDDVRIYNIALTAEQIATLAQ